MKANAVLVFDYVCPECQNRTTTRCGAKHITRTFKCKFCKTQWDTTALFKHYQYETQPHEHIIFAAQYTCSCGKINVCHSKVHRVSQKPGELHVNSRLPHYGLCEECFAEYDLEYPEARILKNIECLTIYLQAGRKA